MAIYPYFSTTIINKDVLTNSSFKAGMALVLDSNGRAIKADSQSLVFDTVGQKYGKFLGFAASDHDISGNTIIIPDVIGANYLDSNLNFVSNENTEYSVAKRSLLDYQDTAVSNFYNASDLNTISKRGIGVYNTPGDYFVTDQFNAVLHGDFGLDSVTITSLNPGDLLTFGGGINAGKLVKVNINSFGPDVIIVGKVYKHLPSSGLLYFRQVSYKLSFGTNPYVIYTDPENPISYNGGNTLINLANSSQFFTLQNGPIASSNYITYDGTNDQAVINSFSGTFSEATFMVWLWRNGDQDQLDGIMTSRGSSATGIIFPLGSGTLLGWMWNNGDFGNNTGLVVPNQTWSLCVVSVNSTSATISLNGAFTVFGGTRTATTLSGMTIGNDLGGRNFNGRIGQAIFLNRALTQTQITNYYNATRGRYGV
jgi:hypothetical protein